MAKRKKIEVALTPEEHMVAEAISRMGLQAKVLDSNYKATEAHCAFRINEIPHIASCSWKIHKNQKVATFLLEIFTMDPKKRHQVKGKRVPILNLVHSNQFEGAIE